MLPAVDMLLPRLRQEQTLLMESHETHSCPPLFPFFILGMRQLANNSHNVRESRRPGPGHGNARRLGESPAKC